MISKEEIEEKAEILDLHVANVQRDYIFGWLLKSIFENGYLSLLLILKGGNCFRKAYFPNARFSDDLDFSTSQPIDPERLGLALNECCVLISERTGVKFDIVRNTVVEQCNTSDRNNTHTLYRAKVYFDDFYGEKDSIAIAVRLDITEFDKIYLPTKSVALIHDYSDRDICSATLRCLSLEEMIADKMKCLLQRRHSHDLFDMAYTYLLRNEHNLNRREILSVFLRKTIFQSSPVSAKNILLGLPFDFFKMAWERYLVCPTTSRSSFETATENFRAFIEELFVGHSRETAVLAFFPAKLRNPIMSAARENKLLKLTYDGVERLVEPYALSYKRRKSDGVAQEYFYCWDTVGGQSGPGVKALLNPKITAIEVLETTFEPRYEIELFKAGETPKSGYFSGNRTARFGSGDIRSSVRRSVSFSYGYTVQCPYCQKKFKRKTSSLTLNAHKSPDGYLCSGRRGYHV
ncbi:nucleotidyl transferase AbiEii/AbiGii toxin family protein [Herbaspirillum huttiense]|uniref:nucleotidyl transferase AbiEii/AbiGii toxin family protein n=1 Tax=Herbaspirillum huttiense TaxID=863372 RepID=UPI0031D29697